MASVSSKYLKDENGNKISPVTAAGSVYTTDGSTVQTKINNMYNIPVNPTDTSNINIWIKTS